MSRHRDRWYGLDPDFARRLRALFAAAGGGTITSGYRSVQEQAVLWEKYGRNRRRVAPPGRSMHNFGLAADIAAPRAVMDRIHRLAPQFGLHFPMSWEPWHIEPVGARRRTAGRRAQQVPGDTDPAQTTPARPVRVPRRPIPMRIPTGAPVRGAADPMMVILRDRGSLS